MLWITTLFIHGAVPMQVTFLVALPSDNSWIHPLSVFLSCILRVLNVSLFLDAGNQQVIPFVNAIVHQLLSSLLRHGSLISFHLNFNLKFLYLLAHRWVNTCFTLGCAYCSCSLRSFQTWFALILSVNIRWRKVIVISSLASKLNVALVYRLVSCDFWRRRTLFSLICLFALWDGKLRLLCGWHLGFSQHKNRLSSLLIDRVFSFGLFENADHRFVVLNDVSIVLLYLLIALVKELIWIIYCLKCFELVVWLILSPELF